MSDDEAGAFEEGGLRRVTDDDGISGEIGRWRRVFVAESDDELRIESGAGFGDDLKDVMETILECAERSVDERTVVEFVPGKIVGVVDGRRWFGPWSGVVKMRGQIFAWKIEKRGLLRD